VSPDAVLLDGRLLARWLSHAGYRNFVGSTAGSIGRAHIQHEQSHAFAGLDVPVE
jgi:hypothetical protein